MRHGMPLTSRDSSGSQHKDVVFNSWLRQQHQRQHSHPSQSKPLPQLLNIRFSPLPPPDPGQTMAARQPSPCRPPAVSVPAPRIQAPPHPLPQCALRPSSQPWLGGEHRCVWGQLEVRMELARSNDLTSLGAEMGVAKLRLSGGEV